MHVVNHQLEKLQKWMKKFMVIKKISVVDQVSAEIKEMIFSHQWEVNEKLPSEGELAEMYGVNRLSVRMALQKLNTLGLVETKVGDGTYVRKFSLAPFLDEISELYNDEEHLNQVKELRNLIEGEAMRLAALHATDEEKQELQRRYDVYEKRKEECMEDLDNTEKLNAVVEADFDFHYQIIRMSHNDLYKDIYFLVRKIITGHIRSLLHERLKRAMERHTDGERHDDIIRGINEADIDVLKKAREEILKILPLEAVD